MQSIPNNNSQEIPKMFLGISAAKPDVMKTTRFTTKMLAVCYHHGFVGQSGEHFVQPAWDPYIILIG